MTSNQSSSAGATIAPQITIQLGGGGSAGASAGTGVREGYLSLAERKFEYKKSEDALKKLNAETKTQIQLDKEAAAATGRYNRSMTMLSISMFVTTLLVRQMTSAVVQLGKYMGMSKEEIDHLNKTVSALNATFGLIMGPLQLYIIWSTIAQGATAKLALTFMTLGAAMGAAFAIFGFMTAESAKLKIAYAALIAMTVALAIATQWKARAQIAVVATNPITAPAAPAMAAQAVALSAMMPKGETVEGSYRMVERSGPFYAHKGEQVGRISAQNGSTGSGGNRSITILSNEPYRTAKMIERYDRRGLGRKRVKRTVA